MVKCSGQCQTSNIVFIPGFEKFRPLGKCLNQWRANFLLSISFAYPCVNFDTFVLVSRTLTWLLQYSEWGNKDQSDAFTFRLSRGEGDDEDAWVVQRDTIVALRKNATEQKKNITMVLEFGRLQKSKVRQLSGLGYKDHLTDRYLTGLIERDLSLTLQEIVGTR